MQKQRKFLQNIDDEVIKSRLGSLERISVSQLILEIKYNEVRWSDTNNQVHLMEATQNLNKIFYSITIGSCQLQKKKKRKKI